MAVVLASATCSSWASQIVLGNNPAAHFQSADLVVTGRVSYHWTGFDPQDDRVYTYSLIDVESVAKGVAPARLILATSGGYYRGAWITYSSDLVEPRDGERVELTLKNNPAKAYFTLAQEPLGFRALDRSDPKGSARKKQYATQGFKWPTGFVIPYRVNVTDNLPPGLTGEQFLSAVTSGVRQWQGNANIKWTYAGTTNRTAYPTADFDGIVDFFFSAVTIGSGKIADAQTVLDGSGGVLDGDIKFDRNAVPWSMTPTGSQVDPCGTAAHEAGHVLGLAHSSNSYPEPNPLYYNATMYFIIYAGYTVQRNLNEDDIAGIRSIYGAGLDFRTFLPSVIKN